MPSRPIGVTSRRDSASHVSRRLDPTGPDCVADFPEPAHPADVAFVMLVDGKGEERVLGTARTSTASTPVTRITRSRPMHLDVSARPEVMELDVIADPRLLEDRHDRVLLRRLDVQDERVANA